MDDAKNISVTHPNKLKKKLSEWGLATKKLGVFLYNNETKEVIGRDGLSWAKICLFYFVFYGILASSFIGLLAIFLSTLSRDKPTYYSERSLMRSRNDLNPGLGFRPQVDPEDNLIYYNKNQEQLNKLTRNLNFFLNKYYDEKNNTGNFLQNCSNEDLEELRKKFYNERLYCDFDYYSILKSTPCDPSNDYGYSKNGPCVAVKLNKIFDWKPKIYNDLESLPLEPDLILNNENILKNNIFMLCEGEYGTDRDALSQSNVTYYSANANEYKITKIGLLPVYFFPYLNQPGYKSPLVFVQFENLPPNQLIHIVCRAYSSNIDSDDKINLRGMTKFQLFVDDR